MAHGNEMLKQRFFFIKLPKNWFKNARIKKLRRIAGGDTYTIIYLKMLLLAASRDSKIIYEGIEKTIEEELALKLDENIDDIKMTIAFLRASDLIQDGPDGDIELIEGHGMVGSESYSNILKKNKQKRLENFQPHSNQIPTIKDKEIDKDKEIEKEIDIEIDNNYSSLFGDKDISNTNILTLPLEQRILIKDQILKSIANSKSEEEKKLLNDKLHSLFTPEELEQLNDGGGDDDLPF